MKKFLLLSAVAATISIAPARADAMDYIKGLFNWGKEKAVEIATPMEDTTKFKAEFDQEAKLVKTKYFEENPISFEFKVPSAWEHLTENQQMPADVDSRLLTTLDIYRGPIIVGGDRPVIKIQSIKLNYEILAEHWLQNYIFQNGFTQDGELVNTSETQSEAKFIHLQNGVSYKSYMKAYIIGDRVLALRYDAPVVAGEQFYYYGRHIIDSFKITDFTPDTIEEMEDFALQNNLKFSYPASWTIKNSSMKNTRKKAFELQNVDAHDKLKGLIRFVSYRKGDTGTIEDSIRDINNSIRNDHGLRVVDLIGSAPLSIGLLFDAAYVERYNAGLNNTIHDNYELWITVLESEKVTHFIYMLTPKSAFDYGDWARNTRAYDLILHSIN